MTAIHRNCWAIRRIRPTSRCHAVNHAPWHALRGGAVPQMLRSAAKAAGGDAGESHGGLPICGYSAAQRAPELCSPAASAQPWPAMCAGGSFAPVERRLGPAAVSAGRSVRPAICLATTRHVGGVAPGGEAWPQRAHVVATSVVDTSLRWVTPHCPCPARLAGPCRGRAAPPRKGLIRVGHVSSSQFFCARLPLELPHAARQNPQNGQLTQRRARSRSRARASASARSSR
jgi:hypothetical protein